MESIATKKLAEIKICNRAKQIFKGTMPIATTPDEMLAGVTDIDGDMMAFSIDPPEKLCFTNYSYLTGKGTEVDLDLIEVNEVGQVNAIHKLLKKQASASPMKIELKKAARYVIELPIGTLPSPLELWDLCVTVAIGNS